MKEELIGDFGMLFFDNLIPHKFLPEILEVIEIVKVKRKDWFFIILFGNDDYFFEDQLGRYQNVTRKSVHINTPDNVANLITEKKHIKKLNISLIWLPKKTLNNETSNLEEKIHFFWHLIHELQHLKQDETYGIGNSELYSFLRNYFLEKMKIKNTLEVQLLLPVELDAEKKTKKIIVHKFKEDGFLRYLRFRINQNQDNKLYYEKIKKIDYNYNFNIKKKTLKLLISEKISLKKKLKEFQVQKKYTDIDIDAMCKSRDIWGK